MSQLHIHAITKNNDGKVMSIELRNNNNDLQIYSKWDGCIDIFKYSNGMTSDDTITEDNQDDIDYLHVCNVNEFINELQQLLQLSKDNNLY